jgi:thiol-disulfide isomerase/thioredoxin
MAAKPIVDGIEQKYQNRLVILRLNIQDPTSQPFLDRYNFQYTPTFILLDGNGKEIWRRVGSINADEMDRLFASLP